MSSLDQHYFLSLLKDATTRARDTMQEWTVLFALDQNNIATIEEWKSALEEIWANSAPWFARAVNSALKDCIAITSRRRNEIRLLSSLLHRPFTNIPQDGFRSFLTADTAKELFEACGEDDHATIDQTHQHLMSYNLENHESISFNLLARRARIVGRAFTGNELCPPVVQVFVQHQGLDFYLRVICISNKLEYASAMEVANFPSFPPRKRIPWFYGKVMFDQNPLHIAATLDIPAMLQHLLTTREYEPLQRACFSLRPIHFAAAKGHTKCLTVLSNHGRPTVGHLDLPTRSWTDQCQARDDMGRYPASYAAMHGHLEALKILTRDQSSKCTDNDWSGRTPISYAAENGHFETVKYLVDLLSSQGHKERLIVSHSDHKGRSPIGYARRNRHYDIVDYLEEIKGRIEVVTID
jgi:hypothetical protein